MKFIGKDNPSKAIQVVDLIISFVNNPTFFPKLGRPTNVESIREMVVTNFPYIAVYEIKDDTIFVVTIHHTSQNILTE